MQHKYTTEYFPVKKGERKMKNRFRSLLVVALILACVLSFSACGSESGATVTQGEQNTRGDDTKPSNSTNSTVGTTQGGVVHTHQFGEWYTVTKATCTEEGLQERSCECGEKETQSIASTGHSLVDGVCVKTVDTQSLSQVSA